MPEKDESHRTSVFISYSADDGSLAKQLASELAENDIEAWFDRNINLGGGWREQLRERLSAADAVLVLVTPSSVKSQWVTHEWSTAAARAQPVIPVVVGGGFELLSGPLAEYQAVRFEPAAPAAGVSELIRAVRATAVARWPRSDTSDASDAAPSASASRQSSVTDSAGLSDELVAQVVRITMRELVTSSVVEGRDVADVSSTDVFIITSFDPDMTPAVEAVKAAAAACGLTARRVNDVEGDYRITGTMLEMIRKARIIVADLTHERPNVYFELGYARGLGKTVVTILRTGTDVHFDVQDWTYLKYFDSRPLEAEVRRRFEYELKRTESGSIGGPETTIDA